MKENNESECPSCGANVSAPVGAETGEIIECPDCGTELEVTKLDPMTYEEAPEEEEDWGE